MTVYDAKTGQVHSLHMTGAAPYAATSEGYGGREAQDFGTSPVACRANFGGWIALLDRFGTMSLGQVLQSAIYYAEYGFPVDPNLAGHIASSKKKLELFPTSTKIYLPYGMVPKVGELLVQKDLANTFKRLAAAEQKARNAGKNRKQALMAAYDLFYKGDIAKEFVAFYQENGGFFTAKDFADYKPVWGDPVHTTYKGIDVYTNGPTTRGGVQTIMELNLLEAYDLQKIGHNSADYLHLLTEVIKLVNADVYQYLCDPKFSKIPLEGMLSKTYAGERRKLINMEKANGLRHSRQPGRVPESRRADGAAAGCQGRPTLARAHSKASYPDSISTTHFDIVDEKGNAGGVHPHHRELFRDAGGRGQDRCHLQQRHPLRVGLALQGKRELRGRREDRAPGQLAPDRAEERPAAHGVGHAGRREHRPDPGPGVPQRGGIRHGHSGCG